MEKENKRLVHVKINRSCDEAYDIAVPKEMTRISDVSKYVKENIGTSNVEVVKEYDSKTEYTVLDSEIRFIDESGHPDYVYAYAWLHDTIHKRDFVYILRSIDESDICYDSIVSTSIISMKNALMNKNTIGNWYRREGTFLEDPSPYVNDMIHLFREKGNKNKHYLYKSMFDMSSISSTELPDQLDFAAWSDYATNKDLFVWYESLDGSIKFYNKETDSFEEFKDLPIKTDDKPTDDHTDSALSADQETIKERCKYFAYGWYYNEDNHLGVVSKVGTNYPPTSSYTMLTLTGNCILLEDGGVIPPNDIIVNKTAYITDMDPKEICSSCCNMFINTLNELHGAPIGQYSIDLKNGSSATIAICLREEAFAALAGPNIYQRAVFVWYTDEQGVLQKIYDITNISGPENITTSMLGLSKSSFSITKINADDSKDITNNDTIVSAADILSKESSSEKCKYAVCVWYYDKDNNVNVIHRVLIHKPATDAMQILCTSKDNLIAIQSDTTRDVDIWEVCNFIATKFDGNMLYSVISMTASNSIPVNMFHGNTALIRRPYKNFCRDIANKLLHDPTSINKTHKKKAVFGWCVKLTDTPPLEINRVYRMKYPIKAVRLSVKDDMIDVDNPWVDERTSDCANIKSDATGTNIQKPTKEVVEETSGFICECTEISQKYNTPIITAIHRKDMQWLDCPIDLSVDVLERFSTYYILYEFGPGESFVQELKTSVWPDNIIGVNAMDTIMSVPARYLVNLILSMGLIDIMNDGPIFSQVITNDELRQLMTRSAANISWKDFNNAINKAKIDGDYCSKTPLLVDIIRQAQKTSDTINFICSNYAKSMIIVDKKSHPIFIDLKGIDRLSNVHIGKILGVVPWGIISQVNTTNQCIGHFIAIPSTIPLNNTNICDIVRDQNIFTKSAIMRDDYRISALAIVLIDAQTI